MIQKLADPLESVEFGGLATPHLTCKDNGGRCMCLDRL